MYVYNDDVIMIDAGITNKQIELRMAEYNISPSSIKKIFITHEHTDHIKGLKVFLKNNNDVEVYMHPLTYYALGYEIENINLIEDDSLIAHEKLAIKPLKASHDAKNCYGYLISDPFHNYFHMTDTGYMSVVNENIMQSCHFVLIESNYDFLMLRKNTKYPQRTKDRIHSDVGHMSNEQTTKVVAKLDASVTKHICFAHMSENNNIENNIELSNQNIVTNKYILAKNETMEINLHD